jgi:hypothetical protein
MLLNHRSRNTGRSAFTSSLIALLPILLRAHLINYIHKTNEASLDILQEGKRIRAFAANLLSAMFNICDT